MRSYIGPDLVDVVLFTLKIIITATFPDERRTCMTEDFELYGYLVTKHSWKGKFPRLLTIGTVGITTYDPKKLRVTNQWPYPEVVSVQPETSGQQNPPCFSITFRSSKSGKMTFSSPYRADILTDLLHFRAVKHDGSSSNLTSSQPPTHVVLRPTAMSLEQLDPSPPAKLVGEPFMYRDIQQMTTVSDLKGGVAIVRSGHGGIQIFIVDSPSAFIAKVAGIAQNCLGVSINSSASPPPLSLEYCIEYRLGKVSQDELLSQFDFLVHKLPCPAAPPYDQQQDREASNRVLGIAHLLCITESMLVERDPPTYRALCTYPLCEINSLIRVRNLPQRFIVELKCGDVLIYQSRDRDALIASLLDAVRASGNQDIYVSSRMSRRGLRYFPFSVATSEETESTHLRLLRQPPEGVTFWDALLRFNANVSYSGLIHAVTQDGIFTENKERLIKDAMTSIISQPIPVPTTSANGQTISSLDSLYLIESQFQALRRLFASKAGFISFQKISGVRESLGRLVSQASKLKDDAVGHAMMDAINALMQPMHDNPDIKQEQLNKASLMSSKMFLANLVDLFAVHAHRRTGALVISSLLDFFTYAICLPYSETSDGATFDCLLQLVANRGRALFKLFEHPSLAIVRGASIVMRALINEGDEQIAQSMRSLALSEGALLHHLISACFAQGQDNRSFAVRQISRQLVDLWTKNNPDASDLLERVFPLGLLLFLQSNDQPAIPTTDYLPSRDNVKLAEQQLVQMIQQKQTLRYQVEAKADRFLKHWRLRIGFPARESTNSNSREDPSPVTLRLPRHIQAEMAAENESAGGGNGDVSRRHLNWQLFFYQIDQDHQLPHLIWNTKTRCELKESMEAEQREFHRERDFFSQARLEHDPDSNQSGGEDEGHQLGVEVTEENSSETSRKPSSEAQSAQVVSTTNVNSSSPSHTSARKSSTSSGDVKAVSSSAPPTNPFQKLADRLSEQASLVSWNHREFRVLYPSLQAEPRVGNYFLRVLLDEDRRQTDSSTANSSPTGLSRIPDSQRFFNDLFRRYLQYIASAANRSSYVKATGCDNQPRLKHRLEMRCMCLRAMSIVYARCWQEIGPVSDLGLLIYLLDRTQAPTERDALLLLLDKLMLNRANSESFVEADGIRVVIDLAVLAHFQTSRASVPFQSNVLQASESQQSESSGASSQKEWWWITPDASSKSDAQQPNGPCSLNEMRDLIKSNKLEPQATLIYSQGLDTSPRGRPDGFLADDDDDFDGGRASKPRAATNKRVGSGGWLRLDKVAQLRWTSTLGQVGEEGDKKTANDFTTVALRCVDLLTKLCESSQARDLDGSVLRPLPKVRRLLTDPTCLMHLVQLLATFEPPLIERVVDLLYSLLDQNPYLARFYTTGAFYFILMYYGSNILPIARLLKEVHLKQAFPVDLSSTLFSSNLTARSILGHMLPDAMIAYLENYPAETFAKTFLADIESPEVIWTPEMRKHLIRTISVHLGDFTPRLHSNARAAYQYSPIPIIVYDELENELFCHQYYLRHLCDTQRFPNYPIREPIVLMREVLAAWRLENDKKPIGMSLKEALAVMGIDPTTITPENEMSKTRHAYFQMSRKYHPDKNPEGKTKFQEVNEAYNYICNRKSMSDGPNRHHIKLMLQTQCIIYQRYRVSLASQKYSGYPMLLAVMRTEIADDNLFARLASREQSASNIVLLPEASQLAYETVAAGPLNAEELRREEGFLVLSDVISRCSPLISSTISVKAKGTTPSSQSDPDSVCVRVCSQVASILAAASQFPSSKLELQEVPLLIRQVIRLLYFQNLPHMCCSSAAFVASFCSDFGSCVICYEEGVLYFLLSHIFAYDYTLEEGGVKTEEATNLQVTNNRLALLSLWALARLLVHYYSRSPNQNGGRLLPANQMSINRPNPQEALCPLLTPYLMRRIKQLVKPITAQKPIQDQKSRPSPPRPATIDGLESSLDPASVLGKDVRDIAKLLTTNSATPYLIWDNQCRAELKSMLNENIALIFQTGQCDLDASVKFTHSTYTNELVIGEIIVRLFNAQPNYQLDDPKAFAIDLLHFMAREVQNFSPQLAISRSRNVGAASDNKHVDDDDDDFGDFVSSTGVVNGNKVNDQSEDLLNLDSDTELDWGVESERSANKATENLSQALEALSNLINHNKGHLLLVETIDRLVASTPLLKDFKSAGGLLYLFELLAKQSGSHKLLQAVTSLLSKCLADKVLGRPLQALLCQYVPSVFVKTLRETPDAFVKLYQSDQENPELIWGEEFRQQLVDVLTDQTRTFYDSQTVNRNVVWTLSDSFKVDYSRPMANLVSLDAAGGTGNQEAHDWIQAVGPQVVCGVYLHLYVTSPGWNLSQPEAFLDESLDKWTEAFSRLPDSALMLRLLTKACVVVLTDRPGLVESLPRKGIMHRLLGLLLKSDGPESAKALVMLMHRMSTSSICVQAMSQHELIVGLMRIIDQCVGDELSLAAESVYKFYSYGPHSTPLVAQALQHNFVKHIIELLVNGLPRTLREPGQTCAFFVKALKTMQADSVCGAQVKQILDSHPNWAEYRDQGHALFVTNSNSKPSYLTGASGSAAGSLYAGYLTAGVSDSTPTDDRSTSNLAPAYPPPPPV